MNLTNRQKKLLKLMVSEEVYKTIVHYSEKMEVSERTLHNDLNAIKDSLKQMNVILHKKPGVGIAIQADQNTKLSLLNELDFQKEDIDPLSTKIRTKKITLQLLYSKQTTSLQKLSDEFMVSKTSIVKDLDKIESWLSKYHLNLIKNREGTKIEGSEENIRKAIAGVVDDLLKVELREDENHSSRNRMDLGPLSGFFHLFNETDIEMIENTIIEAEEKLQYKISDPYYINLITHLLILIQRIESDNKIIPPEINTDEQDSNIMDTYPVSEHIATRISKHFNIKIPKYEIAYINQYLMCAGIENHIQSDNIQVFLENTDEELKSLTKEMIEFSSRVININLNNDAKLYMGLLMHIKPMINRLKYSIHIENPLLEEVKNQYSAMFGMTWLISSIIDRKFGLKVSEDEIGYLTVHFQAAIERSKESQKVIVVCPGGMGTSQLIANRIRRFVPQIEVQDVMSLKRLDTADLSTIDFIISTVPLKVESKPVIIISSLVNKVDIKNINNFFIDYLFKKKNAAIQCSNLFKVLDNELIFTQLELKNKTEIIHFLCDKLYDKGYTTLNFEQSILDRESIAPTSLGNAIAIPHGEDDYVTKSKVIIATLKNEVNWGKENVKIIFLMALKLNGDIIIKDVLTDLYSVFDSDILLNDMINCKNPEQLTTLLLEACQEN